MLYSTDIVEQVRSRTDIIDVISKYVKLDKAGSTHMGLCPFHNEKTPSFSVSRSKQMFYCFGCHVGGNVYSFLMKYDNLSFVEAVQELAPQAGVTLPVVEMTKEEKARADRATRLFELEKEAAVYFFYLLRGESGAHARRYFEERKLTNETIKRFGLGYADVNRDSLYKYLRSKGFDDSLIKESDLCRYDEARGWHDFFWNRAMFPIMNVRGKVIAFGGRVMGEGEPKYLNSAESLIFNKSKNLFALNIAHNTRRGYMLLCEGYMDVISLHQAGFDNAVASLGTAFTSGHASLLKRYTDKVYITYDSDKAGTNAALKAIPMLRAVGLETKVVNMTPYKDPDEFIKALGAEEYEKRIEAAENGFFFELRITEGKYDLKDPTGKSAFLNEAAERLLTFEEEIERESYISAVAEKYKCGVENLKKSVAKAAARGVKVSHPEIEIKSGLGHKQTKEDAPHKAQRMLLTWLTNKPEIFGRVKRDVEPTNFSVPIYREAAEILFEQLDQGEEPNVAAILSRYEEGESHEMLANAFFASVPEFKSEKEADDSLGEIIAHIKKDSVMLEAKETDYLSDPAKVQAMIEQMAKLKS